nr:virulence factor TspB C-terminal domain-related protein [Undibacterium oligocarboniphilum]
MTSAAATSAATTSTSGTSTASTSATTSSDSTSSTSASLTSSSVPGTSASQTTSNGSNNGSSNSTSSTSSSTSNGTSSSTSNGNGDDNDFCKKHPELNICKNSSVQGRCAQTSCDGDAITCAILRTQQQRDCEDHDDNDPQVKLGKQLLSGDDPLKDSLPNAENAQVVDLSGNIVNADGWGGGGQCFTDKTFSVSGRSFVLPLSSVCDYLLALRFAVMLMAALTSYKMVSGTILRDL